MTAKAARNSRSNTSVSLTLAAVATHATGTPSPSTATLYLVPRLARSVGLGPVRSPARLARTEQLSRIRSGWRPQHADQQGVHLRQHTRLGPACEPPPQGRAARLRRCRGQTAPGCALAQEAPQSRQHPDCLGRRMAAAVLPGWIAHLNHCRDHAQNPAVQGCPPCLTRQTWAWTPGAAPLHYNQG